MTKHSSGVPTGTWVLIADGEKALFMRNEGDDIDMNLTVIRKDEQENPMAQNWAANKPGRFNDGPSVHRSAVQDTDWHELEKERFATDLADYLYQKAHAGAFDKLIIAASRPVLSALRDEMHSVVQDKLLFDVAKVLTNHPLDEVEKIISIEAENA